MAVERIRTLVVPDHDELAGVVARRIADLVREKTAAGGTPVLGLATGSTATDTIFLPRVCLK